MLVQQPRHRLGIEKPEPRDPVGRQLVQQHPAQFAA